MPKPSNAPIPAPTSGGHGIRWRTLRFFHLANERHSSAVGPVDDAHTPGESLDGGRSAALVEVGQHGKGGQHRRNDPAHDPGDHGIRVAARPPQRQRDRKGDAREAHSTHTGTGVFSFMERPRKGAARAGGPVTHAERLGKIYGAEGRVVGAVVGLADAVGLAGSPSFEATSRAA